MEKDRESWGVGVRRLEEADGMKIVVFLLLSWVFVAWWGNSAFSFTS